MNYIIWDGKNSLKNISVDVWLKSYPFAATDTLVLQDNYVYFIKNMKEHLNNKNISVDDLSNKDICDLFFLELEKEQKEEEKNRENLVADVQQLKKDKIEIIKSIADVFESIVV